MILIRRQIDRERAYTAIFLPGEAPRVFPTSDYEHARILQIYKQDRAHPGIENDFSDDRLPPSAPLERPQPPVQTTRPASPVVPEHAGGQ